MTPVFGDYLRLPKYCGIVQNGATSANICSFDTAMTDEINALILRLEQELKSVEQLATEGLNIAGDRLERSPNNARLIQLFAYLNNSMLLVVFLRRRIEYNRLILATDTATERAITRGW